MVELLKTFAMPIVSTIGICIAILAIVANRRAQREQTARNAHLKYIELAMSNYTLAFPEDGRLDFNDEQYNKNDADWDRYEWFVSFLLSTCSYVWECVGRNHPLSRMMRLQVAYHWPFIEHYRDKREYLSLWAEVHPKEFKEGIALGKDLFPQLWPVES
jgi:hypothetical protein